MIVETINHRIAHQRKIHKLTQKQVAEMLNINYNTYAVMERKGDIKAQVILDLAAIFGVSTDYLLYGTDTLKGVDEPFTPPEITTLTKNEKDLIKIVRYASKEDRDAVYDLVQKIYLKSMKKGK